MIPSQDIEERAAYWLMRREEPDWSELEEAEFQAWMNRSAFEKAAFWRLEYGYSQADRLTALATSTRPRRWTMFRNAGSWAIAATVAAVLVISIATFRALTPVPLPEQLKFATAFGQTGKLKLPDGTLAELNAGTKMRVLDTPEERLLWLDQGEIYLDVAHERHRPFIVHAGANKITVMGTKFVVAHENRKVITGVVEGRVRVGRNDGDGSLTLTRGDLAISGGKSTLVRSGQLDRIESAIAWRRGMVIFGNTPLAEAAALFNRYNRKPLLITDPATAKIEIGGSFRLDGSEEFARLLEQGYGLKVHVSEHRIEISKQ